MISKKIVFWVSFILALIFIIMLLMDSIVDFCDIYNWCNWLLDVRSSIGAYFLIFPVVFLFSLITYKMNDGVSRLWSNFSYVAVPIFVAIEIFLMNNTSGGGYVMSGGYFNALIILFLLFLYFLISLILIIYKYFSLKKNTQNQVIAQK